MWTENVFFTTGIRVYNKHVCVAVAVVWLWVNTCVLIMDLCEGGMVYRQRHTLSSLAIIHLTEAV